MTQSNRPDPQSPEPQDPWQELNQQVQQAWGQLEQAVQGIPAQTERTVQQTVAQVELQLGGAAREAKDALMLALTKARLGETLDPLTLEIARVAQILPPNQIEIVLRSVPGAMDRAVLASGFYQWASGRVMEDPSQQALQQVSARSYGLSGLPLVLERGGSQIDIKTSAVLITTLVAIDVASATAGVVLQLLGSPELKKLLALDGQLRKDILKKGGNSLASEGDEQPLRKLLKAEDPESDDGWLWLASLGIQGAQVAEFVGLQIRSIVRSDWLRLAIPIPLVLEALQLLTSDLMLSLGTAVESNLEATSAARRVELVLEALPRARRIPTPEQVLAAAPAVLEASEAQLRPLLSKQLTKVANSFDPQLRNKNLNDIGRQLNLWNPFQVLQGWSSREWVIRLRETMEELWQDYPSLAVLQTYVVGLEAAQDLGRTMEQAQALRQLAKDLHPTPEQSEDTEN